MSADKRGKLKEKAAILRRELPTVSLALRKKKTPLFSKILILCALVYALSPVDLIPDFIPWLGLIDDFIILPLLLTAALKLIPHEIMDECRAEAEFLPPQKSGWYFALPFILIWAILLIIILKAIT